jgi:hypothetical protein
MGAQFGAMRSLANRERCIDAPQSLVQVLRTVGDPDAALETLEARRSSFKQ